MAMIERRNIICGSEKSPLMNFTVASFTEKHSEEVTAAIAPSVFLDICAKATMRASLNQSKARDRRLGLNHKRHRGQFAAAARLWPRARPVQGYQETGCGRPW